MTIGFAHRGSPLEYPENSLAGFTRALTLGASGLETDVWITSDGVAVLDHDGRIRRGLRRRRIATLPSAAVGDRLPTLLELYELPGADAVQISLDVKDPRAASAILTVAGPHLDRLWLCSGDVDTLMVWHRTEPSVRLVHSTARRRLGVPLADHPRRLAELGIDALNLRAGEWTPALVDGCQAVGVRAFGWAVRSAAAIERLVAMEIDAVYCDDVETMTGLL